MLTPKDLHCILMFDEMSIQPGIFYDHKNRQFIGLENFGDGVVEINSPKIADHATTFMLRGLNKP